MDTDRGIRVGIETTERRTFASALDWPGWSRSGRTPGDAIAALAACWSRYAAVAQAAGIAMPPDGPYEVVEERPGDATTAFGAPAVVFDADRAPIDDAEAERQAALVAAALAVFDAVIGTAPAQLRTGPRGGGRDRDGVAEHVRAAHHAYTRPAGAEVGRGAGDADRRAAMLDVLRRAGDGHPAKGARWPSRYAARRIAWHALDHAWEVEDRSAPW